MAASDPSPGRASDSPPSGSQGPAERSRGSTVGAAVAARVEEIVRTAEREAAIIQRDLEAHRRAAEQQAQRYLEDAKRQAEALVQSRVELVRELSSELVEYAETTRRQVDALIAWLDRATERLQQEDVSLPPVAKPPWRQREGPRPTGAQARPRPGRAGAEPPAALRSVTRKPEPARPDAPDAAGKRRSAGKARPADAREASLKLDAARLLAIEMAVSGHTREEVDAHLREAFRVTDTAQLLDDVFGREGGEPRTGWTSR